MRFVEIEPKNIINHSLVVAVFNNVNSPWVEYVKAIDGALYEYSPRTDNFDKFYLSLEDEMSYFKFFIVEL